jgi:hypothetical protein
MEKLTAGFISEDGNGIESNYARINDVTTFCDDAALLKPDPGNGIAETRLEYTPDVPPDGSNRKKAVSRTVTLTR